MEALIRIALGGLIWRLRGGLLDNLLGRESISNAIGRSLWSLFITALYFSEYPLISPIIFALAYLGCAAGYFKGQFSIREPQNQNWKNYARLTARGMFTMLPAALFLTLLGDYSAWGGVIAGALFVPCYKAGIPISKKLPIQGYTQWGEILYGAAITAGAIYG